MGSSPLFFPPFLLWTLFSFLLGRVFCSHLFARAFCLLGGFSPLFFPLALFLMLNRLVDRRFGRPPLLRWVVSCRLFNAWFLWSFRTVRGSLRRWFYRSNSASDALFSAWFLPLFFGRLFSPPLVLPPGRSLARPVCRLLDRSVCRFLDRSACWLLGRSLCRLLDRSVCRLLWPLRVSPPCPLGVPPPWPLSQCVSSLTAWHVGSLTARYVASLPAPAGSPFAGFFCRLPLAFLSAFLCSLSWPGVFRWPPLWPFCSFSPFFRIPLGSRLRVAPSSWGFFTRLALEALGHGHRMYFRHPQGPFGYWEQGTTYHRQTEVPSVYMLIEAWNSSIYRGHGVSLWYGFLHDPLVHGPPVPFCSPAFQVITLRQHTHFITLVYWIITWFTE